MKNSQKGFVVPLLIVIIAVLVVGGGIYVYENKKAEVPATVDSTVKQSNPIQQETNTPSAPVITHQNIPNNSLVKTTPPATNVVVTPGLKIISPNGGDVIDITKPLTVSFKPDGYSKHYSIKLQDDSIPGDYSLYTLPGGHQDPNMSGCVGGPTCNTGTYFTNQEIAQSPNKQSITVTIPESMNIKPGNMFKVQVWEAENSMHDESNSYFTVTNSQYVGSLTYSGMTDTGVTFSVKYPPSWVYYKFSCNADGVAFWPKSWAPNFSQGSACSANGFLNTAPIIISTMSQPTFTLQDKNFVDVYNQMTASLTSH